MTPSARLAAATDILDTLDLSRPVEPQLKAWARANRYAGSKDRRAIADRVYAVLRHRRSSAAHGGGESGRALLLGSLIAVDRLSMAEMDVVCSGGYGLAPLTDAERAILSRIPDWSSEAERLDWPEWLWEEAVAAFGTDTASELAALRRRAPLDLRVNTLKATPKAAMQALRAEGLEPERVGPLALRLPPGAPVQRGAAWAGGLVELQDAGSQAVAALTGAQPGETVLDYCAGAGGKTLALAAATEDRGAVLAHDIAPARMADLPERARRAGIGAIRFVSAADLKDWEGRCDRVLVDAPCSGSGSWRRDPAGKWTLTRARLDDVMQTQDAVLASAARYTCCGGALTYATCSILKGENEERVAAFIARNPAFRLDKQVRLHPARDCTDGFFAARLIRCN
jgi:16S rRNA (cytosine967-C5)-methyltransferase